MQPTKDFPNVRVEFGVNGRVDVVIDRPDRANALDGETAAAVAGALRSLEDREDVRVVVLRGEGRNFCGGADIREMSTFGPLEAERFIRTLHRACDAARTLSIPVVAQVRGASLGGGLELMTCCDLTIASDEAFFGMPEPHVGLPSVIEAALLPGIVGLNRARELLLIGDNIDANRALEYGLVTRVVPDSHLEMEVAEVVGLLARHDRQALALQKGLLQRWLNLPMDEAVESGVRAFAVAMATGTPQGIMETFLEKRKG